MLPRPGFESGQQWAEMPKVAPPESCLPYVATHLGVAPRSHARFALVERLHALPVDPQEAAQPNRVALWTRIRDQISTTPAMLGWLADMVGLAIAKATPGRYSGATSLDNTLRISGRTYGEWVLVDLHGESVHAGYGHGRAALWSADGQLLATASQTAVMRPANPRS
jgi:acyl-CoA thioesterase